MRIYINERNSVIFAKDDGTIIRAFPTGNFEVTLLENNKLEIKNPIFDYQETFLFSEIKTDVGGSTGATIADTQTYLIEKVNFRKGGISEEDLTAENITEIQGEEGSVQYKNELGKLFGDAFLTWKNRLLAVWGSVIIRTTSSLTGNALEVRNATNQNLKTITNKGEESKVVTITGNPVENIAIDTTLNYTLSAFTPTFGRSLTGDNLALNVNMATAFSPTFLVGRKTVLTQTGANAGIGVYHHVASWNEVKGNGLAGYFNNAILVGDFPVYHAQPTSDPKGYFRASAYGASAGMTMDLYAFDGGMKTVARFSRSGSGNPLGNMLDVGDGAQLAFYLFIDRTLNSPNAGANDTATLDYLGVRVKDTTQFAPTTEMFFKTTQAGASVEPLSLEGENVNLGVTGGAFNIYANIPTYADNAAALVGGLAIGRVYQTLSNSLQIVQ